MITATELSARNHLRMLAAGSGIPYARADEVLEFVGLAEVAGKRPKSISLGMAQRLGLAQALLGDPGTLILDEPANGLDPHGIHWLRDALRSLASDGRTVFVSSHLLSEMELMADRLVVIGRERLIYHGDVAGFVREFTRSTVIVRSRTPRSWWLCFRMRSSTTALSKCMAPMRPRSVRSPSTPGSCCTS
jgi:ABC-2 type transport system ATP-binding protein